MRAVSLNDFATRRHGLIMHHTELSWRLHIQPGNGQTSQSVFSVS
jgi:hypothetical protein